MENCKNEIKNKVAEIFGDKDNVILVPYSGRIRFCFPCPEKDCSFSTVDMGRHLQEKHKWTREENKLQTSYNHVIFDYVTRMKTYCINKPCICFTCCCVYNRIDSHVARNHFSRGADEYVHILKKYRKKTEEILFSPNSFKKDEKHNLKDILKKIKDIHFDISKSAINCDNQIQLGLVEEQASSNTLSSTQQLPSSSSKPSSSYSSSTQQLSSSSSKPPSQQLTSSSQQLTSSHSSST